MLFGFDGIFCIGKNTLQFNYLVIFVGLGGFG